VRFQYLSPETIARLVDSKYDEITLIIWKALCPRLLRPVSP
jgi:hypothetical protein